MTDDDLKAFSMFRARIAEANTAGGEHPYLFDTMSLVEAQVVSAAIDRLLAQEEAREADDRHFCIACHHEWSGDDGPTEYCGDCHRQFQSLKAQEEARGVAVAACPRCSAHEPEWLPDAGCWVCNNCMVHLDAVEHWQRVPPPEPV